MFLNREYMRLIYYKRILLSCVMLLLTACAAPRPSILIPKNAPPVPPAPPPQVTLVLGSGGARAFAEIGVIKVLEENHIPIDLIIGTSSGSIVGAIYADNPNWRHLRNTLAQAQRSDLIDISALHVLEGPITGNALQNFIFTHVRAHDFRQLKLRFIAVATDLKTGASVPIESGPVAPAINASSAIPPYFHPVPLYGHIFIDGSTTDPIAVDIAQLQQSKVIIAVNVAADFAPYVPGNLISNYDRTYTINDYVFNKESAEGADIVIHPKIGEVGIFDATQKYALIKAGEIATRNALPQICAILSKNYIASDCSQGKPKPQKPLQRIKEIIKKDLSSLKLKK